jgi:hypothetical protein
LNITGPGITSQFVSFSGDWCSSSSVAPYIQNDINSALIWLEQNVKGLNEEDIELHVPRNIAFGVARCQEYKHYIQGSLDALAAVTDHWNPNRKYGLASHLYGILLKIEGCKYPSPEMIKLVKQTSDQMRDTWIRFNKEAQRILFESKKDSEPHVLICEVSDVETK